MNSTSVVIFIGWRYTSSRELSSTYCALQFASDTNFADVQDHWRWKIAGRRAIWVPTWTKHIGCSLCFIYHDSKVKSKTLTVLGRLHWYFEGLKKFYFLQNVHSHSWRHTTLYLGLSSLQNYQPWALEAKLCPKLNQCTTMTHCHSISTENFLPTYSSHVE